jgi:cell wall-associated NlpC family hydrolase
MHVSQDELMPGDLVFYYSDLHHVGIYIGDGWLIHAPTAGENVKQVRYDAYPIYGYGRPG